MKFGKWACLFPNWDNTPQQAMARVENQDVPHGLRFIDTCTKKLWWQGETPEGRKAGYLVLCGRAAGVNNTVALIILMPSDCRPFHYRQESYGEFNYPWSNSRGGIRLEAFHMQPFNELTLHRRVIHVPRFAFFPERIHVVHPKSKGKNDAFISRSFRLFGIDGWL